MTYQQRYRHDYATHYQGNSSTQLIDDQHFDNRTPDFQRALNAADHQAQLPLNAQADENSRQVVLDCSVAAHLRHKLQQRSTPKSLKERPVREEQHPGTETWRRSVRLHG